MILQYNTVLKLVSTILLCSIVGGCTSLSPIKPNDPYPGPYPPSFKELSIKNPLLAHEFGKLPEIQDGISDEETTVLENLIELYKVNPDTFGNAFEQMYKIGIPKVRKYCTPLQALFWLAQQNIDVLQPQLENYHTETLIEMAWNLNGPDQFLILPGKKIIKVIDGIKDEKVRNDYYNYNSPDRKELVNSLLYRDYKKSPDIFSKEARNLIEKFILNNAGWENKWSDFNEVTARLNSPELINYYEQIRFMYAEWRTIPDYVRNYESNIYACARYVFNNNRGDCSYTTGFTIYCLRKAGYKAFEIRVKPDSPKYEYHAVCVFYWDGEKYVMDNGRIGPRGIIRYDKYMSYKTPM